LGSAAVSSVLKSTKAAVVIAARGRLPKAGSICLRQCLRYVISREARTFGGVFRGSQTSATYRVRFFGATFTVDAFWWKRWALLPSGNQRR